ncbi:site-2 protease family protein [Candidatus Oleimmundimicrobium sp.]|uniref:site-2 protease family protein n=1 Tax=Candidatus Oleimmundimicrobium sp. TaxID=3060597 RepID=UPI00271CFDE0|nr:site-2 protease family protein [Candidatus Oleimmundimicrobium sp.]MDO8886913.1 site-2 protease family protein [Candidatus Oleimmundimicrobium sp.]
MSILVSVVTTLLFFSSLLFHELCHSYIARLNSIPIRKITLFIFGGVAEMTKEPPTPAIELKMAIAGPLASLFLSGIFYGLFLLAGFFNFGLPVTVPLSYLALINLMLAIFNLVPGFPLDGGRIFRAILWFFLKDIKPATKIASLAGQGFAYLLILVGFLSVIQGIIGGIWFILIGWFLNQAAQGGYRQIVLQKALSGVRVSEIMTGNVLTVVPSLTLDEIVNDYFLKHRFGRFPVVEDDKFFGVITIHDVKEIPREKWPFTKVSEILQFSKKPFTISPGNDAVHALMQMVKEEVGHLLVIDKKKKLVGIVTRTDIIRLIKVKTELGM